MMHVSIESMNQRMNFATKQVTNTIVLRLPSGAHIEAAIPDGDVQRLINEVAGVPYEPPARQEVADQPPRAVNARPLDDEGVTSFGGGGDVEAPAAAPSPSIDDSKPKMPTVRKDEFGGPILTGDGFRDPSSVVGKDDGTGDRDEDGVGQA